MKTIREFLDYTNMKGARIRYSVLLIFASVLYCMFYLVCTTLIYSIGASIVYYVGMYLLSIVTTFFYMIILFQFILLKRGDMVRLKYREYLIPLILVQSIYFIILAVGGLASYSLMMSETSNLLYGVVTLVLMLAILMYLPMQIMSFFLIYDNERNPFVIIAKAFQKVVAHYQSIVYSLLLMLIAATLFTMVMKSFYGYGSEFMPSVAAMDIMLRNNPFIVASELLPALFSNGELLVPTVLSILYGVFMCCLSVYYFMVMVCIYDHDIRL